MQIYFNRTFTVTENLVDLLKLKVDGKEDTKFAVRMVENLSRRELSTDGGPSYTVYAVPDETIR